MCKDRKRKITVLPRKRGIEMATYTLERERSNSNIFEIKVSMDKYEETVRRLEKPSLTKEYLDECKRVSKLFQKPTK